jgi:hypothetical protein
MVRLASFARSSSLTRTHKEDTIGMLYKWDRPNDVFVAFIVLNDTHILENWLSKSSPMNANSILLQRTKSVMSKTEECKYAESDCIGNSVDTQSTSNASIMRSSAACVQQWLQEGDTLLSKFLSAHTHVTINEPLNQFRLTALLCVSSDTAQCTDANINMSPFDARIVDFVQAHSSESTEHEGGAKSILATEQHAVAVHARRAFLVTAFEPTDSVWWLRLMQTLDFLFGSSRVCRWGDARPKVVEQRGMVSLPPDLLRVHTRSVTLDTTAELYTVAQTRFWQFALVEDFESSALLTSSLTKAEDTRLVEACAGSGEREECLHRAHRLAVAMHRQQFALHIDTHDARKTGLLDLDPGYRMSLCASVEACLYEALVAQHENVHGLTRRESFPASGFAHDEHSSGLDLQTLRARIGRQWGTVRRHTHASLLFRTFEHQSQRGFTWNDSFVAGWTRMVPILARASDEELASQSPVCVLRAVCLRLRDLDQNLSRVGGGESECHAASSTGGSRVAHAAAVASDPMRLVLGELCRVEGEDTTCSSARLAGQVSPVDCADQHSKRDESGDTMHTRVMRALVSNYGRAQRRLRQLQEQTLLVASLRLALDLHDFWVHPQHPCPRYLTAIECARRAVLLAFRASVVQEAGVLLGTKRQIAPMQLDSLLARAFHVWSKGFACVRGLPSSEGLRQSSLSKLMPGKEIQSIDNGGGGDLGLSTPALYVKPLLSWYAAICSTRAASEVEVAKMLFENPDISCRRGEPPLFF